MSKLFYKREITVIISDKMYKFTKIIEEIGNETNSPNDNNSESVVIDLTQDDVGNETNSPNNNNSESVIIDLTQNDSEEKEKETEEYGNTTPPPPAWTPYNNQFNSPYYDPYNSS